MASASPDAGIPVSAPSVAGTPENTPVPPTYFDEDDTPSLISSVSDAGDAHTALDIADAETSPSQADLPAYAPPSPNDLEALRVSPDAKVAVVFASPAPNGGCACGARAAGSAGGPGTCPARRGLIVLALMLALLGLLALLDQEPGYFGSDMPCEHFGRAGGSNAAPSPHMHDHLTGRPLPAPAGAPADGDTVWFTWSSVEVTEVVGVGARAPDAAAAPAEGEDVPTLEMTVARTEFAKWGGPGPYPVPQGGVRPVPLPLPISAEDAAAAVEGEKA